MFAQIWEISTEVENYGGKDENWSSQTQVDSPERFGVQMHEEHRENELLAAEAGRGRQAREVIDSEYMDMPINRLWLSVCR